MALKEGTDLSEYATRIFPLFLVAILFVTLPNFLSILESSNS